MSQRRAKRQRRELPDWRRGRSAGTSSDPELDSRAGESEDVQMYCSGCGTALAMMTVGDAAFVAEVGIPTHCEACSFAPGCCR
jgi:hypothetical protein